MGFHCDIRKHQIGPRVIQHRLVGTMLVSILLIIVAPHAFAQNSVPDWTDIHVSPFDLVTPIGVTNPVLTGDDVTDVPARFVADPFLFHEQGQWFMFFELLNEVSGHGEIGLATSQDGLQWQYDRVVLAENWHLSYPYMFKHDGEYYLIPESNDIREIRLYRATDFPYGWTYYATIASGRDFIDSSVFYYNNRWWMFSGDAAPGVKWSMCYLFFSDDLASGWTEHPLSPVVADDKSKARGAGRSFVFDHDRIIRLAQKCDVTYGEQVRAFQVDLLSTTEYQEHELLESPILSKSGSGWNASGMHHFDPWWNDDQWICAVDGVLRNGSDEIWSIGIYVTPRPGQCELNATFQKTVVSDDMRYYTDRIYQVTGVPSQYIGMDAIITPNEERLRSDAQGYLTFEMPIDGKVYVAYDRRATVLPNWMIDFSYTGNIVSTSLSSQGYLRVYEKAYTAGQCINFGANYAPGSSSENRSNYIVFY